MTLEGIDVSYAQSHTPSLAGKAFAFAKATEGTTVDPMYSTHMANFRAAGIVAGAYHFGLSGSVVPIASQVSAFLTTAAGADLLALDVEGLHPMTQAEAQAFITAVRAKGRKCGLYASRSGYPIAVSCDFRWIADYTGTVPNISWQFWQYTSNGTASGLDLDRFNGDQAALDALAGKGQPMNAPTMDYPYLCDVAAGGSAYYDLACTQVAIAKMPVPLPGVVTFGTAKRPDGLLMRDIAIQQTVGGPVLQVWVGAEKCTNVRPKSGTQTVTVTGTGITITGP